MWLNLCKKWSFKHVEGAQKVIYSFASNVSCTTESNHLRYVQTAVGHLHNQHHIFVPRSSWKAGQCRKKAYMCWIMVWPNLGEAGTIIHCRGHWQSSQLNSMTHQTSLITMFRDKLITARWYSAVDSSSTWLLLKLWLWMSVSRPLLPLAKTLQITHSKPRTLGLSAERKRHLATWASAEKLIWVWLHNKLRIIFSSTLRWPGHHNPVN